MEIYALLVLWFAVLLFAIYNSNNAVGQKDFYEINKWWY